MQFGLGIRHDPLFLDAVGCIWLVNWKGSEEMVEAQGVFVELDRFPLGSWLTETENGGKWNLNTLRFGNHTP